MKLACFLISFSASEEAFVLKVGVAGFDLISSLRGVAGENGGSSVGTLAVVSASSGIVSLETGRVVLAALRTEGLLGGTSLLDFDAGAAVFDGTILVADAVLIAVRAFVGVEERVELVALARDESVEGRLGGADVVALLPNVVFFFFSALESGRVVRELRVAVVGVRTGRFSSFVTSSVDFVVVGLRTEEDSGRVGGFVMVVPFVRDDSALLAVGFVAVELKRDEVAACLFASSLVVLLGFLSIVLLRQKFLELSQ